MVWLQVRMAPGARAIPGGRPSTFISFSAWHRFPVALAAPATVHRARPCQARRTHFPVVPVNVPGPSFAGLARLSVSTLFAWPGVPRSPLEQGGEEMVPLSHMATGGFPEEFGDIILFLKRKRNGF